MVKYNRAVKVPIHPSIKQRSLIYKTFGCTRKMWNLLLECALDYYRYVGCYHVFTPAVFKDTYPYLKEVDSLALANVQMQFQAGVNTIYNKNSKTKHLRFKSKKDNKNSYTTNNAKVADNKIYLPKVGWVKANIYRTIPTNWKLKYATVSASKNGKLFAALLYEYQVEEPSKVAPIRETTLGIDYSSPNFYIDSNGNAPETKHFFRQAEAKLGHEQRLLSRIEYGSKNYKAQLRKIQKLHEHIANKRKDFIHKQSTEIANQYNAICLEDLNLQAIAQSLKLGKATNDNGFGLFRILLAYKLEERGKSIIKVDRFFPSSQLCSCCGYQNTGTKDLSVREWTCSKCRTKHNRDINAAINIKNEGLRLLGI